MLDWPQVIQGGMGIGVSNWRLARAVSCEGQMGTVSLVALPHVAARRLQQGDTHMLRALEAFPIAEVADRIREKYWRKEKSPIPMFSLHPPRDLAWLTLFASFAEVWLAKEGHDGKVAGNLLEEVQTPTLLTLLGAMWAGIDAFIIGAGLPTQIPEVLDALCVGRITKYRVSVLSYDGSSHEMVLDLNVLLERVSRESREAVQSIALNRPAFFPIVSLHTTASILWRKWEKAGKSCDGFIVEHPVKAGGHNPSPRGWKGLLNEQGEPVYTERDTANIEEMKTFRVPFWLAGGYAHPEKLQEARACGATGIQCGSIFALSQESGIGPVWKSELIRQAYRGELDVRSDPRASPTGFPFQVVSMPGTVSDGVTYEKRERICNLGYLRKACITENGISYRCPAEPVQDYVHKGGNVEDTVGRKCLCNNLLAQIGLGMTPDGVPESPIITLGKDTGFLRKLIDREDGTYTAADAVHYLLGK